MPKTIDGEKFYNASEAAKFLGISRSKFNTEKNKLDYYDIFGMKYYREEDLKGVIKRVPCQKLKNGGSASTVNTTSVSVRNIESIGLEEALEQVTRQMQKPSRNGNAKNNIVNLSSARGSV